MSETIDHPMRSKFVDEYMIDGNGTQAAIRAGYAPDNAKGIAYRLLCRADVREEVDRRIAENRAKSKITVTHIEGWLRDMTEVEILDLVDEQGNARPLQDIPAHARRAIKSVKKEEYEHPIDGVMHTTVKFELWDKMKAIEMFGKYKKMFTDKIELSGELKTKVSFSINGVVK
jgi:phage terminase small subunit